LVNGQDSPASMASEVRRRVNDAAAGLGKITLAISLDDLVGHLQPFDCPGYFLRPFSLSAQAFAGTWRRRGGRGCRIALDEDNYRRGRCDHLACGRVQFTLPLGTVAARTLKPVGPGCDGYPGNNANQAEPGPNGVRFDDHRGRAHAVMVAETGTGDAAHSSGWNAPLPGLRPAVR
jgi:hypothetical protein